MKFVFGYGSNMGSRGLAAKGVRTTRSLCARLSGYDLAFDVPCPFYRVEGGVANVVLARGPASGAEVHGVVHEVDDEGLARIDGIEAVGVLYERRTVNVRTYDGQDVEADVYVGVPAIRDATLRPSSRYLGVLVEGATEQGVDPAWIQRLRSTPPHAPPRFGRFNPPAGALRDIDASELARHPKLIALGGVVFDLSAAGPAHSVITRLRGGRDLTPAAVALGAGIDESVDAVERQAAALHELQHELALDYPIVGRFVG
jgi:gamma-glutamylcyclotransferase (GGCT)/AIG2-like uncharacterized protein YtfP